jgi:hypothetical protein
MAEALARQPSRPQKPGTAAEQLVGTAGRKRHRIRALAAVAALVATQDVDRYGVALLESVARVEPPSARLKVLEGLRWSPPLPPHVVLGALDWVAGEACGLIQADIAEDTAVHYLQRAYVARACHTSEVTPALASAVDLAGPSFLACEVIRSFPDDAPATAVALAEEYLRSVDRPTEQTLAAMVHLRQAERLLHREGPAPELDQLLQRADKELHGAARRSRWQAEHLELRGVVATTRGQLDEARSQFRYARSLRERLGDAVALRVLDAQLESVVEPGSAAPRLDNAERALTAGSLPGGDEVVVRELVRHLSGDARDAMSRSIESARFNTLRFQPQDAVVRVESSEPELLALPWELVANRVYRAQLPEGTAERDIAWLRWALRAHSDVFRPELLNSCLRVVESGEALPPSLRWDVERVLRSVSRRRRPRVAIIKGSERAESSWGYSQRSRGLNLESSYRSAGWDVIIFTAAEFKGANLRRGLAPLALLPVDVLHLSARMEISGTLSWLDTSAEELSLRGAAKGSGTDTGIFATDVARWLGQLAPAPGEVPPPVVVLDPVVADLVTEPDSFLAGRNQFASQLYLDGMTMAVVAAGLAGDDPLAVQQAWLDGVAHDEPLEEVVRALRAAAPPAMPPALFAPSRSFKISVS